MLLFFKDNIYHLQVVQYLLKMESESMVWVGKCKKCGARFSKPAHLKKGIGGVLLVCPNCNSHEWSGEEWTDIGAEWKDK
jgi:predicted Zn-ribbon and HTH transcriptional regulator